jgi:hypothetical protein
MKILKPSALFIFLICTALSACISDNTGIGENFLDSSIRTVITDTCSVRVSTVAIDSVVTSGRELVLTGSYSDTTFGKTKCIAYVPFSAPGSYEFPDQEIVFDSLNLVMELNGTWFGDTVSYQDFNIHMLEEVIDLPDDNNFYSTWSVPYASAPVSTFSVRPRPVTGDTLSVRLPDPLGEDLLEKIMSQEEEILGSQERFMNYFKGFAITAGPDNKVVLGMAVGDSSMVMKLYYHYTAMERTTGSITVYPYPERCFYGVETDRTGTPFSELKGNELLSGETGSMVLVQALTGSYVRIDFPYLNNLPEAGDFCFITRAYLIIYPVRGTYSGSVPLPEDLSLYVSNENDVTLGYITTYSGDALQTGSLVRDDLFGIETYYSYDITSFVQNQLGAFGINKRSLQLIVPEAGQAVTLNTLVAADGSHPGKRMEIKITYIVYDSN